MLERPRLHRGLRGSGHAEPHGHRPRLPGQRQQPRAQGLGQAGSTVKIYSSSDCSGSPLASGSAATFNGAGITTPVPADQTTNLRATATDSANNASGCSPALAYTEDSAAPGTPSLTDTDPDSPANDNNPEVKGTAEAGSTVRIYSTSDCSGSPLASGTAGELDSPGLTVNVAADQTTSLRARASDRAGNESDCSAAIEYTEDSTPPDTELTDAPLPESAKRKVKFAFSSTEAQSTFRCSIDKGTIKQCKPPLTKRVERGTHVFRVYALDRSGNADATPAKMKFKVIASR